MRGLAREIDAAIAGFVRGQTRGLPDPRLVLCRGADADGLNFGLLIGLITGLLTFIPYVGSLTGLCSRVGVAIAQFWPDWTLDR